MHLTAISTRPTLNSIRQTDVDILMIRTQSRVRVRVRVIYSNQTGVRHQIFGSVGIEWCTPDRMLRVRILLILSWIVFFLKNWRHFDFYEHFIKKFHIRKVKCLVRGGCQFGGCNQVTTSRLALPRNLKVANMCSVDLKCKYSRHTFYFKRGEEELYNVRVPQFHSTPWPPNENLHS